MTGEPDANGPDDGSRSGRSRRRAVIVGGVLVAVVLGAMLHGGPEMPPFEGERGGSARVWDFAVDARQPCWLRVDRERRPVIRVNCFAEAGVLYTHSNRMASMASWLGRSWTQAVADQPELDVLIDGRVYPLRAVREESEAERVRILKARGYGYVPDGIQVFALVPRNDPRDSMPE